MTTTPQAWRGTNKIIEKNQRIKVALGLHPQLAHEREHELPLFEALLPETKYVGEVGLDGNKNVKQYLSAQQRVFSKILAACESLGGKVLSVHSRAATKLTLDIIEQHPRCGNVVLHWFTGNQKDAMRALHLGCFFSVNTAMLTSDKSRALLKLLPKNRILTESDGPFIMYKNKPLSPLDMGHVVKLLAELWNEDPESTDIVLMENFKKVITT